MNDFIIFLVIVAFIAVMAKLAQADQKKRKKKEGETTQRDEGTSAASISAHGGGRLTPVPVVPSIQDEAKAGVVAQEVANEAIARAKAAPVQTPQPDAKPADITGTNYIRSRNETLMLSGGCVISFGPRALETYQSNPHQYEHEEFSSHAIIFGTTVAEIEPAVPDTIMISCGLVFDFNIKGFEGQSPSQSHLDECFKKLVKGIVFKSASNRGIDPSLIKSPSLHAGCVENTNHGSLTVVWGPVRSTHILSVMRQLELNYSLL